LRFVNRIIKENNNDNKSVAMQSNTIVKVTRVERKVEYRPIICKRGDGSLKVRR